MRLINPKCKLVINLRGESLEITDADINFNIEKDLTEDPNDAEFIVYNANNDTQEFLKSAAANESPLEFYATTIEHPDGAYKRAFAGEVSMVENENLKPGYASKIYCSSQKRNHREFWFQKTYAAGTYDDDIINDLLATIGLPKGNVWEESTGTIILSKSFSGPAYELLQRFQFDRGQYCYIMDGKIYTSMVDVAPSTELIRYMSDYVLRGNPEEVIRSARNIIEMKTIIEVTGRMPEAFKVRKRRRTRKKKDIYTYGENDLVEYNAVEQDISGLVIPMFLQPDINPDHMISYGGILHRVIKVQHEGDNFGGDWDTTLTTDIYEDTGGDFI